jgi:predicted metalloprotease with PDZ domain
MMKPVLLLCIPFLLLNVFAQTRVNYEVVYSKTMEKDGLTVKVSTKLDQPADSTYFHFSNKHWGEENLLKCLTGFSGKKYSFRVVPDSNRIVVYHPKSDFVSFSYRIKQDHEEGNQDIFFRPRVQQAYFHIPAESMFVVPESIFASGEDDPMIHAELKWTGFPADYAIHNMFGSQQREQVIDAHLWSEFYNALFVGGDYRIHPFMHNGKNIYLAIRGDWYVYTDEALLNTFRKTLITQRQFWNDDDFDYYTVIITPTFTDKDSTSRGQGMNGTRMHHGFMIQSTNNTDNSEDVMRYIFNHEMMHDWIGGKITMQQEELNYWFSEGFTDYYAFKNRLRNSDVSMKEWTGLFNTEVIKAHYRNPQRNIDNYVIKDDFWKSRDIEKVPYRRGAIFALWVDLEIQKRSNGTSSLDDVMRDLLRICDSSGTRFSDELFLSTAKSYLNEDITYFFQKHVIAGVDFDMKQFALPEGMILTETHDGIPQMELEGEQTMVKRRYLQEK